jgi:hypothetical protein
MLLPRQQGPIALSKVEALTHPVTLAQLAETIERICTKGTPNEAGVIV